MTIEEAIAELREKAKEQNLDVDLDDEDLIVRALGVLRGLLAYEFSEIEEEEE